VSDRDDRWHEVGLAIEARIEQLGTIAEFTRASGVSFKTLKRYMAGEPIVRIDKRRDLTAALGWTSDSIDRILAGESPIVAPPTGKASGVLGLMPLDEQVRRLRLEQLELVAEVRELAALVNDLTGVVKALQADRGSAEPGQ
jgi:hypothetical protein